MNKKCWRKREWEIDKTRQTGTEARREEAKRERYKEDRRHYGQSRGDKK